MLGGYKLIDFGGVDISTSKTISGIYNEIEKTEKRIVGCNLKLGTTTFKELTLDVKANGTSYELSNSILKITVTNANVVVGIVLVHNLLENIVDDNGDLRFNEGSIDVIDTLEDYVIFSKWSLSGTHLLLVLCIYNTSESDITISGASQITTPINLPQWVKSKIYPMGTTYHVMRISGGITGYKPSDLTASANPVETYLMKANNDITINTIDATFESGFYYRFEYNLLIDME